MKPYGLVRRCSYPHYREYGGVIDRGGLNDKVKKGIDQEIELWYNGWEDYYGELDKVDPFICDCTLRPDIEYYLKKRE